MLDTNIYIIQIRKLSQRPLNASSNDTQLNRSQRQVMEFLFEPMHSDNKAHRSGSKWSKINNRNGDKLSGEN